MRRVRRKRLLLGFTALELMAVAAIVGGIYSASSSAYIRARQKGLETQCAQNLRQVALLIQMYEMENGKLPNAAFFPKDPRAGTDSLSVILGRDAKTLLVCPSVPDEFQANGLTFLWNDRWSGKPLSSIPDPRNAWLLVEVSAANTEVPAPHRGGYNVLYADLQVRWSPTRPPLDKEKVGEAPARRAVQQPE